MRAYVEAVDGIVAAGHDPVATTRMVEQAAQNLIPSNYEVPAGLRTEYPSAVYTRNLVYSDPELRFAVVAIVWGSFRESRIHDHMNWCVVRCLAGTCFETSYSIVDDAVCNGRAEVCVSGGRLLQQGGVLGIVPPPRANLHRMANAGWPVLVTLHTYGDPGTRARVFDPVERSIEIVNLQFHNLLP